MKKRHHTPEQIIRKRGHEGDKLLNQGEELAEVCRQLEIAESTWLRIPTFSDTQSGVFGHLAVRSEVAKRPTCV